VLPATSLPRQVVHPAVWGHSAPRRNRRQAKRQQVIADLFGIVDLVALAGLFNSLRMMRLPEPPAPDTLRETTLGLGMPDMLASSPTCSVEGLMDDLA
jgi:hypothetical protein